MLFLSPWFLWFLTAATLPVAIHLINRRRHKTIQWAAMQFLLKASRESRGKKKLRHILILACRALALAALAIAAARPVASGLLGWGGRRIDTVVLVLDRSASMEAVLAQGSRSRRIAVLEDVRNAMKAIGTARLVLIDSASGEPQEIASPEVLGELSATAATDGAADMPALFNRAVEYLAQSNGQAEIWLASDMQESNWKPDDDRWSAARATLAALPKPPHVRVLASSAPGMPNDSLRLLSCLRDGNELVLDVEITRSGDAAHNATVPLTTHLNGVSTTGPLAVPGQTFRFQKRVGLGPENGEGCGWLSIPGDGNPRDNVAFFAYGAESIRESLIVAENGEIAQFIRFAAAPPGLDGYAVEQVSPQQAVGKIRDDLAAVFWLAPFPEGPAGEALQGYLERGGQVVFFSPPEPASGSLDGMIWSPIETAPEGKYHILGEWNRLEGPMRDGIDGTPVGGNKLKAIRRRIPDESTTPLATWEDGQTFLSRRIFERGAAWFVGSVPDYTWSNLADADVLLPLVLRAIAAGAERQEAQRTTTVGSARARPIAGEPRERLDTHTRHSPGNDAHEAGVFRIGEHHIAVNRPPDEDDSATVGRDALDLMLSGTGFTYLDRAGPSDRVESRDIWQSFLVLMLLFLFAEAWLCLPKKTSPVANPAVS